MYSVRRDLRAAVIGGGVLGVATAVHLARHGAQVQLVTEDELSSGASGRSLSWLNSWGIRSTAYHDLRMQGMQRYRDLAEGGDADHFLRFEGGLRWVSPENLDDLRKAHEHMQHVGYPSEWLSPADVGARVPGVDAAAVPAEGAMLNVAEGWVDLSWLIEQLARELVGLGGVITTHAGVAEAMVEGNRVDGIATATGDRFNVDAVVVATGANVPTALGRVGISVPDATPNALLVRTAPVDVALSAVLHTPRVAVRPAPGGRLVMDSGWSEREVMQLEDGSYHVPECVVPELLQEASAVLAGAPALEAEACGVGPKPVPGDGQPILGRVDGITGYHVAFTHSGATLGLIAGELVADEVVRGEPNPLLESFRPSRFIDPKPS